MAFAPGEQVRAPVVGYALALSWSPEFCRRNRGDPEDRVQCDNRFGFIVHGLWPQARGRLEPRFCEAVGPIAPATLRRHLCTVPGETLMQRQWAAHGSCGWPTAESYFAETQRLRAALTVPDADRLPANGLTAGAVRDAFVAANPRLPRAALFVDRTRSGWLEEVRICYDRRFRYAACETPGAPDRAPVRVQRR